LIAFRNEMVNDKLNLDMDFDDMEYSLLKQRLYKKLDHNETKKVPSLIELTKIASYLIQEDLERLVEKSIVNKEKQFHCVVTGIQIHGPGGKVRLII
jgi:hypothetical protein